MTNESGSVTDTLVFDAFGNETAKTGATDNSYGFQGEEKDDTGLYYLRARYMDPATGTFTSMDTYGGSLSDPMSLHEYLFANSNPVAYCDPSGHFSLVEMDATMAIDSILNAGYISGYLYIIDASVTDPNLEHHDFIGYLGAIGAGMLFATMGLVLSATVTGLLVLAIIDTLLGAAGTIKGIIDIINGHPIYGGAEIIASVVLVWNGWRNYAGARSAAKATSAIDGASGTDSSPDYTGGERNRIGKPVKPTEKTIDMALDPEEYAYAIAKKYGINLKGSGQKIKISYNPDLVSAGHTSSKSPNTIELGPSAYYSEEELANTIAHELNHARSFIAGGNAPEQGPRGGYAAGDALAEYVRGER